MKKIASIIIIIAFALPLMSYDITIATSPWPPYAAKNLPEWGFTSEVVREAYKAMGHNANLIITDWSICLEKGATGEYQGLYNVSQTDERAKTFAFSESHTLAQTILVSRAGRGITYTSMEDLKPYKFCVMKGYANSEEFDNADFLDKIEVSDDLEALKALADNRVDMVAINRIVATYIVKNNPTLNLSMEDIEFVEPPLKTGTMHLMFSKANKDFVNYLMDFNNGLTKIKKNGTYLEILKKHGFDKFE